MAVYVNERASFVLRSRIRAAFTVIRYSQVLTLESPRKRSKAR